MYVYIYIYAYIGESSLDFTSAGPFRNQLPTAVISILVEPKISKYPCPPPLLDELICLDVAVSYSDNL